MNRKFKTQFAYDWIYYLLVIVLSVFVWSYTFKMYHSYKKDETVRLFFEGSVVSYDFEQIAVSNLKNNGLNKLEIASSSSSDITFKDKYNIVGLNNSDIVLVSKSIAEQTACSLTFAILENNYGSSFFTQEDKNYGIILNDGCKEYLSQYFKFSEDEYVIMIHQASLNTVAKEKITFSFLEWMVTYEK